MKSIAEIMPGVMQKARISDVKQPRYQCELCNDTGIAYRVEDDDGIIKVYGQSFCTCIQGKRKRYWGVPDAALDWTWVGYPGPASARDDMQRAMADEKWALLMGPVGTGKTGLTVCAYKDKRDAGVNSRFYNMAVMFDEAKASFSDDRINPMERYQNRGTFLVLDGLGERPITEWERGAVAQLLGQRYSHGLQTCITTNWPADKVAENLGPWVVDRVRDAGVIIKLTGRSMRG